METNSTMIGELEGFKSKEKFLVESDSSYVGLQHKELQPVLNTLLNKAADDFIEISRGKNASEHQFQDKIKIGLSRFDSYYLELDTEDRERICLYFEELMDIVKLESSGGHLNEWMYGFDPS